MNGPLEKVKGHRGVYKRGGRYIAVYRDQYGKQRKVFASTIKEAEDLKAERRTDVRRGEHRSMSRQRFDQYAREWVETCPGRTKRGLSRNARDDYRDLLNRLAIPFFGSIRLAEVEPQHVKRYAKQLADHGLKPSSVKKALAPVKALFADALEDGLIRSNPAAVRVAQQEETEGTTPQDEKVKALTAEELTALLDELPEWCRPFFEFLVETGLRIGEAVEVRFADIDFGRRRLRVDRRFYRGRVGLPKGRKRRRVPLSEATAQALWTMQRDRDPDEIIFTAERGGRIDSSNLMARVLKPAAVRAGVGEWVKGERGLRAETWVGFHSFRHTCATMLFRDGWNAKQVCMFLGHTDPGFTLRTYVHLLDDDLPEPQVLATVGGNKGATGATETDRDDDGAIPLVSRESPDEPRPAEMVATHS